MYTLGCILWVDCKQATQKGIYSKIKEFAHIGSKFYPFCVDPFSEKAKTNLTESPPLKVFRSP